MASSLQIRAAGRVGAPRCGQDTECWYASRPPSGSRLARRAGRGTGPPRLRPGPPTTPRSVQAARFGLPDAPALALEAVRHLATVLGELAHHRLVQGDVLLRAAGRAGVHAQLVREPLARVEARVEVQQLQQVHDRGPP